MGSRGSSTAQAVYLSELIAAQGVRTVHCMLHIAHWALHNVYIELCTRRTLGKYTLHNACCTQSGGQQGAAALQPQGVCFAVSELIATQGVHIAY